MPEQIIKVGIAAVVKRGNKILLGKRLKKAGYGEWGLPGGHLEFGESLHAGLRRELLEETGLTTSNLKLINVTNDPRPDQHYVHFVFVAEDVHGEPQNLEPDLCAGWEWFDLKNLPEPIFFGHEKLLKGILANELLRD